MAGPGGQLAEQAGTAQLLVGEPGQQGRVGVTEKWVLDTVQFHCVMPFSDYPVTP